MTEQVNSGRFQAEDSSPSATTHMLRFGFLGTHQAAGFHSLEANEDLRQGDMTFEGFG